MVQLLNRWILSCRLILFPSSFVNMATNYNLRATLKFQGKECVTIKERCTFILSVLEKQTKRNRLEFKNVKVCG